MEHSSPDMTVDQICTVIDLLNPALMIIYMYMILLMTIIIFPSRSGTFSDSGTAFHNVIENHRHFVYALTLRHCRPI